MQQEEEDKSENQLQPQIVVANPAAERAANPDVEAVQQQVAAFIDHPEAVVDDDDPESAEIDLLMQSAQDHDESDDNKRVRAG